MKLPIEEQDIRFEDIVCEYRQRYETDIIRTDEMMSVKISDLFILRNDGFDVNEVINLWKKRGWIVINENYKKGNMGGVEFAEFELTNKFPKISKLKEYKKHTTKSVHQSSGVIAHTININDSFNKDVKDSFNKKTTFNMTKGQKIGVVGVFTIISGIIAILVFFNLTPSKMEQSENQKPIPISSEAVSSKSQNSGITAHTVNINNNYSTGENGDYNNDSDTLNYPQSDQDFKEHLKEQFEFLKSSAKAYDDGAISEAKRIATTIRVLLHDTDNTTSLLKHLNKKDILFYDTSTEYDPKSIIPFLGLVTIRVGSEKTEYGIPLDDEAPSRYIKGKIDFNEWWNEIVLKDNNGYFFSRKDLVLNLANKDGGTHVDSKLPESYNALTRENSLGWKYMNAEREEGFVDGGELATLRQIGHEVIKSLSDEFPEIL